MWNNSKPKSSSYFSQCNGTVMARAVRGKSSDVQSYPPPPRFTPPLPPSLPTRSALPLRMVISDMARRKAPSPQIIKNLSQAAPPTALDTYLQESRAIYSEPQYGSLQEIYQFGRKNKNLPEKNQTCNVINDMRKKFNLMYGKPNDGRDETEEEYDQINEADQTTNPQKIKFTELYGKRPELSPPDMMSFSEFIKRVNKRSAITTPQKRSWTDESFDGKYDDAAVSEVNGNSRKSWKKRYMSTEMFLHSIQEEWSDNDDGQDDSGHTQNGVEEIEPPNDSHNDDISMDARKRKGGIFNDSFEMSPEKKNRFAASSPFRIFGNADDEGGDGFGEESVTPDEAVTTDEVLSDDMNNKTVDCPFYEELANVCSQDSIYSDDSTDTTNTAFRLNNVQLYDGE